MTPKNILENDESKEKSENDEIEEIVEEEGPQENLDEFSEDLEGKQEELTDDIKEELSIEEISGDQSELSQEGVEPEIKKEEESVEEQAARIQRQLRDFHRNQIEAALYAAGKPLSIEIISTKLELPKKEVEELINELAFDYLDRSTSLVIAQMGDRYQMQIKPEYTEKVSKFAEGGAIAEKYLRTLTIIALKQPILKSMVIKLRGTGAYEHIKYLQDNEFLEAKKKGRSEELTTTEKYAEMFGLPKDREEMKRVMVAQLGIDDNFQPEPENE